MSPVNQSQYILCSPNTLNTEYTSAPNTHVWGARGPLNTDIFNKHRILAGGQAPILAEYNSRFSASGLLHFLSPEQCIALNSQMNIVPIFHDMTTRQDLSSSFEKISRSILFNIVIFTSAKELPGRSVKPFQPSREC